jgi:hypothetical protein
MSPSICTVAFEHERRQARSSTFLIAANGSLASINILPKQTLPG